MRCCSHTFQTFQWYYWYAQGKITLQMEFTPFIYTPIFFSRLPSVNIHVLIVSHAIQIKKSVDTLTQNV